MNDLDKIKIAANHMRKTALDMAYHSGQRAHYGGGLSTIDILAVLYMKIMKLDPKQPEMPDRDRFILSKGHGVLGYYAALHEAGFLSDEILDTFQQDGSLLGAHPVKNATLGIESSNGSLGQGLSFAIGNLLAGRKKGLSYRAFVLMGDGEENEGSVWEAAMAASHYHLYNLIAIVDHNGLQSDGSNEEVMNMNSLTDKWCAFGWNAIEVDGHDAAALYEAFTHLPDNDKPTVFVAKTVKGKGVSFMENDYKWHHEKLSPEQYEQALKEIEER